MSSVKQSFIFWTIHLRIEHKEIEKLEKRRKLIFSFRVGSEMKRKRVTDNNEGVMVRYIYLYWKKKIKHW